VLAYLKTEANTGPDWPGEPMFILEPNHGLPQETLDTLTRSGRIVEFIDSPASRVDQLRSVLLTAAARHWLDKGPMLVLLCDPAAVDAPALLAEVKQNPDLVRHGEANSGVWFLFGTTIVGNPNFTTFFRNMQPGMDDIHIAPSLDIMREHLT